MMTKISNLPKPDFIKETIFLKCFLIKAVG